MVEEEIEVEATQKELVSLFEQVGSSYEPFGAFGDGSVYQEGYLDFVVTIIARDNEIAYYDENGYRWATIKNEECYFKEAKDSIKRVKELMEKSSQNLPNCRSYGLIIACA